jgi:F-type H+-transporting ATPase subunit epsilon
MLYARLYAGVAMSDFVLNLFDATQEQRITGVTLFVGEDASGFFGIAAHHARFMTTLGFGLARFRLLSNEWHYLALPEAVLYFNANELTISTRHFLMDTDFERISRLLEQQLLVEENNLRATRESLQRMEQAMFKRLLHLKYRFE